MDFFLPHPITPLDAALRLLLAGALAGLIGVDRSKHNQAAGFRTHILISLASAIIMEAGLFLSQYDSSHPDPTRMAAQVVSGIGFLGAGAIFRFGFDVKGLTTAASLWSVSALGLAAGAGLYFVAIAGTLLFWIVLKVLEPISHRISPHNLVYTIRISGHNVWELTDRLRELSAEHKLKLEKVSLARNLASGRSTLSCHLTTPPGFDSAGYLQELAGWPGVEDLNLDAVV